MVAAADPIFGKNPQAIPVQAGLGKQKDKVDEAAKNNLGNAQRQNGPAPIINWKNKSLHIDRTQIDKSLLELESPTKPSMVRRIILFIKNLLYKIGLAFLLIKEKPPEDINFQILAKVMRPIPDKSEGSSLPILLSYIHEYFKERARGKSDHLFIDDQAHAELFHFATTVVHDLEKLAQLTDSSKGLCALRDKIINRVKTLKGNEKVLIPASYKNKDNTASEALIEITKAGNEKFNVRYVSLNQADLPYFAGENRGDGKIVYNPVLEYTNVEDRDLNDSIAFLLQIQLPEKATPFITEALPETIQALFKADSFEMKNEPTSPLSVMTTLYKQQPKPAGDLLMKIPAEGTSKVALTYMKTLLQNRSDGKAAKLELELKAFARCVNEGKVLLARNQKIRDLVYASAHRLLHELETTKGSCGLDSVEYERIAKDVKHVIHVIKKMNIKSERKAMPQIRLSPFETSFSLYDPTDLKDLKACPTHKNMGTVALEELGISFNGVNKVDLQAAEASLRKFESQVEVLNKLYKNEDFVAMEAVILHLVHQLPDASSGKTPIDFWQALSQTNPQMVTRWSTAIHELNQFLFDSNCCQAMTPIPSTLLASAKLFTIGDRLMYLTALPHPNSPYRTKTSIVTVYPESFMDLMKNDRFFRLSSATEQKTAESLLTYWKESRKHPLNAAQERVSEDREYWEACFKARFPDQEMPYFTHLEELEITDTNVLPPKFVQQKKGAFMLNALICQTEVYEIKDPEDFLLMAVDFLREYAGEIRSLNEIKLEELFSHSKWKRQKTKLVREKFKTHMPPINKVSGERAHIKLRSEKGETVVIPAEVAINNKNKAQIANKEKFHKIKHLDSDEEQILDFELGIDNLDNKLTQQTVMHRNWTDKQKLLRLAQSKEGLQQILATAMVHPEFFNTPSARYLFELILHVK